MPIKIVSNEEAEEAAAVICGNADDPRHFDDDIETQCANCGKAIIHRPHAPKKPKKLCIQCGLLEMKSTEKQDG